MISILLALPLVSIFYLNQGAKAHKSLMSQLGNFGKVSFNEPKIDSSNQIIVVGVPYTSNTLDSTKVKALISIATAFQDDDFVDFYTPMNVNDTSFLNRNIRSQRYFIKERWIDFVNYEDFKNSSSKPLLPIINGDKIALLDTNRIVVNYYNWNSSSLDSMITHAVKIRPVKPKPSIEYLPSKEL